MRNLKKAYRIACIAIGKRKVHAIILCCLAAVICIAYQNNFAPAATVQSISGKLTEIKANFK